MTEAGVYIHIPFCRRRCGYCAFYSTTDISLKERYVAALGRELSLRAEPFLGVDTVYLGGGTPSLLKPGELDVLLSAVRGAFDVSDDAEITLEANPGTLTAETLAGYREAGVNRLVLGIQSFDDDDLTLLGRMHGPEEGVEAVTLAREAGFENLGFDLIYAIPGRSESHWLGQMERAVQLKPDHLSCYALTFEEGTPLGEKRRYGKIMPLPEEEQRRLFLLTLKTLSSLGYPCYEVSNFAKGPALCCRHNRKYWSFAPYLGFGPGAHSFTPPVRSWNAPDLAAYLAALDASRYSPGDWEELSTAQMALERLLLGLRTAQGVDIVALEANLVPRFRSRNAALLRRLTDDGLAILHNDILRLTAEGMAVGDAVPTFFDVE